MSCSLLFPCGPVPCPPAQEINYVLTMNNPSRSQHRTCDLVLASLVTLVTGKVAYRASVVLGTVLLQTAPPRGLPAGRMEAFLRAMREVRLFVVSFARLACSVSYLPASFLFVIRKVERHPQVLHLPAPHIWQLTPAPAGAGAKGDPLVVTLELHVREDLGDDDVLALTRWAWERCVGALGGVGAGVGGMGMGMGGEGAEVTVGVVRG